MYRHPYFHHLFYPLWASVPAQAVNDTGHYPPIDTRRFQSSANEFHQLLKQSELLLTQIQQSPEFAKELMEAAQQSNQAKVDQLVASVDETITVECHYTPDGIQLKYRDRKGVCCVLTIGLGW
ncbi:hypothetical protein [Sporosarcina cascadiensis]|uniref:hypothetical protein n=1 Tax=Sporosarcina cascadiensis TaxID=2660747 RepID=UPI00129B4445|nr:hypothetical protein [Sporosarcina cascadiensis]